MVLFAVLADAMSGLYVYACSVTSVISNCLQPHGLWSTSLLCPWDFPGKNTGVGFHALLQAIFLTQRSTHISCIQEGSLLLSDWGSLVLYI